MWQKLLLHSQTHTAVVIRSLAKVGDHSLEVCAHNNRMERGLLARFLVGFSHIIVLINCRLIARLHSSQESWCVYTSPIKVLPMLYTWRMAWTRCDLLDYSPRLYWIHPCYFVCVAAVLLLMKPFISPAFNLRFAIAEQRQKMISPFVSRQPATTTTTTATPWFSLGYMWCVDSLVPSYILLNINQQTATVTSCLCIQVDLLFAPKKGLPYWLLYRFQGFPVFYLLTYIHVGHHCNVGHDQHTSQHSYKHRYRVYAYVCV